MSSSKREFERRESIRRIAIGIAIEKKAITECEDHPGTYLGNYDSEATQNAYRFGNYLYSKKDPRVSEFKSREELLDTIKQVIEESGMECYDCVKILKE
jgi:hypothetical protein